jgi:hypothetical protein
MEGHLLLIQLPVSLKRSVEEWAVANGLDTVDFFLRCLEVGLKNIDGRVLDQGLRTTSLEAQAFIAGMGEQESLNLVVGRSTHAKTLARASEIDCTRSHLGAWCVSIGFSKEAP